MLKYKCLVLDHDDTVVNSSATVHYPSFIEYMKFARPALADRYTLKDYFEKNFHPGIIPFLADECGLSPKEIVEEERFWRGYVDSHVPRAYEGICEVIADFRSLGGIVAVDSHSYREYIERDYRENRLPMPDVIYGWELPPEQRKPSPYTILQLRETFGFSPSEILVVDDLKPGYDMARAAGCDFAAAGWAYEIPSIEAFMKANCDYYLKTVGELHALVCGQDE